MSGCVKVEWQMTQRIDIEVMGRIKKFAAMNMLKNKSLVVRGVEKSAGGGR